MSTTQLNIFILAGGFGTRLKKIISDVPKPMAPILNKPFLVYQIQEIRKYFPNNKIYILTHYLSNIIENYFENNELIEILEEKTPLGTAGSIKNAINQLKLTFDDALLVFNGDTYIKPNLNKMIESTTNNISILGSFQKNCDRYGTLKIENNQIIEFNEKKAKSRNSYINAGCYYFKNLTFFMQMESEKFIAIEDKFKEYLLNNTIDIFRYNDIFIDIGVPKDYKKMINYVEENAKE